MNATADAYSKAWFEFRQQQKDQPVMDQNMQKAGADQPARAESPTSPADEQFAALDTYLDELGETVDQLHGRLVGVMSQPVPTAAPTIPDDHRGDAAFTRRLAGAALRVQQYVAAVREIRDRLEV